MTQLVTDSDEYHLELTVKRACARLGLFYFHNRDSAAAGCAPGWPDDVIVGYHGVLWRELKSATGRLSPPQAELGARLTSSAADWALWRPADDRSGRIERELRAIV